jgi:hypothetical protein
MAFGARGVALTTLLVIVSRNRPDLYAHIAQLFFADARYLLIFDRRRTQRRRVKEAPESDRRKGHRRTRPEVDGEIRVQGWAVVAHSAGPLAEVVSGC